MTKENDQTEDANSYRKCQGRQVAGECIEWSKLQGYCCNLDRSI